MLKLYEFQKLAAWQIHSRFTQYDSSPLVLQGTSEGERKTPFIQKLDSITGSGKTVILADAVAKISESLHPKPLIFWMSESVVVVEQTLKKLSPGGDYYHLLGNALVADIDDYEASLVRDNPSPIVYCATVDTFNRKEKDGKKRKIFRDNPDSGNENTWENLKKREFFTGEKRKLLVVYDEAQNLTDQQTELLWELLPDALFLATATMRLPKKVEKWMETLKEEKEWKEEDLTTRVEPNDVIEEQLVKERIILRGHKNSMEDTVFTLVKDFKDLNKKAEKYLNKQVKVIYVCRTNLEESASRKIDSAEQSFKKRKAPPILIWRFLTEKCGIEPNQIAVYSKLNFSRHYPPPRNFRLFKGGNKDF
jgi:type III restriction enzyme